MNKVFRIVFLLFFCLPTALSAGGGRENNSAAPVTVQVTGRVRLVGSSLFPELVITSTGREWHIERDEEYKLKDLQQRTVTVEGNETVKTLTFANGQSAGERRTLSNIRIIAIE